VRTGFLNSLIYMLLIVLIIPGMIPCIASAAEDSDTGPDGDENPAAVDLVIESLSFDPKNPEPGQEVEIIASVKNQGAEASESTNMGYFISGNSIGESEVPEIEAGQIEEISFLWKPDIEEDKVYITAIVDQAHLVAEIDEDNNGRTRELTFKSADFPDLVIDTFNHSKYSELGEEDNIEIGVRNQGISASEKTKLKLYIGGDPVNEWDIPSLPEGESSSFLEVWTPTSEGPVEIKAVVDEEELVNESNEENNKKAGTVTVVKELLPDLVISNFEYPEKSELGKDENIKIGIRNQGISTSEKTKLKLYIGGNPVKEWDISSLPEGESSELFSEAWAPTSEGPVEIKAVVDEEELVNESNEENNKKAGTVTVGDVLIPDLVVEDILPEKGDLQVGKLSNFTAKIKNQGTAPSEEVLAKYYVNGNAASENIHVPALSEGAGADISFTLTPEKEDPIEVKVLVDSETAVRESNETNNQLTKVINFKAILPDLKIESLSLNPETPKPGENIVFTVTIKNDGPGDASNNELRYNINGTNEGYSGKIPVSTLTAGSTTSGTFFWTPANEGQIEAKAIVDAEGIIPETEETNNEYIKTATVYLDTGSSSGGRNGHSRSSRSSSGSNDISKEPISNVDAKELSTRHVINGYHVSFEFVEKVTCITYIEFDPKKTFKRTTAIVEELKNKSAFVPEIPTGRVYKYVNIWVGDEGAGLSDSFKNGFIEFKVEKAWIKENNVNESQIILQWYDKGWQPLYTEKVREDSNYIYFRTETPGFSCFAITEYIIDENGLQEMKEEGKIEGTLRDWNSEKKESGLNGSSEEGGLIKNPMGKAKVIMAISLPLFMILVEYFIVRKKI